MLPWTWQFGLKGRADGEIGGLRIDIEEPLAPATFAIIFRISCGPRGEEKSFGGGVAGRLERNHHVGRKLQFSE